MRDCLKLFLLASFLATVAVVPTVAAELELDQWPTKHRDPGNTSSTSVDLYDPVGGEELKVLWRSPGGGIPLVYSYTDSGGERVQRVITGPFVYDAWTGDLVAVLPYAGEANPMDGVPTVGIDTSTGVLLTYSFERDKYYAYDLRSYEEFWTLDRTDYPDLTLWPKAISAKNGVFCITSYGDPGPDPAVAAVGAAGNFLWQRSLVEPNGFPPFVERPALATVDFDSQVKDVIYLGINFATAPGLYARDLITGEPLGSDIGKDVMSVCADEAAGLVFAQYDDVGVPWFDAWTAQDAGPGWLQPVRLDHVLPYGVPPTLGWVNEVPAVFVVTAAESLYAVNRLSGEVIYQKAIPGAGWVPATYAGGKLYVSGQNGDIFVHDVDSGTRLDTLAANDRSHYYEASPVVVEILDDTDPTRQPQGVMYYWASDGDLVALNRNGTGSIHTYRLSLEATPRQIGLKSSSSITATFEASANGQWQPIAGALVQFSCDAGNNAGYLDSQAISDTTDAQGQAHTTFFSEKRAGVVTITAETVGASPATVTVSVTKSGGDEPPPPSTGSIQGTVYHNGKPARKLTVILDDLATQVTTTITTNPKGQYAFDGVSPGEYKVSAAKDGSEDFEFVSMPTPPDTISGVDLSL